MENKDMTKNKVILFLVLLVTTTSISSNAAGGGGFLIEPGIGYKQETLKLTDLSQNLTQYKFSGPMMSLKLGVLSSTGVSLAIVGERSSGKVEIDPVVTDKPKFSHTIAGFQIGVSAMNAMKIYLGYAPYNQFEVETNTSAAGFKLSGHTYQAGVMFFPFQYIGLGAQYNVNQYNEVSGSQFTSGKDTNLYFDKIDSQDLSFSLSIFL